MAMTYQERAQLTIIEDQARRATAAAGDPHTITGENPLLVTLSAAFFTPVAAAVGTLTTDGLTQQVTISISFEIDGVGG